MGARLTRRRPRRPGVAWWRGDGEEEGDGGRTSGGDAFEDSGEALATADAHGLQPVARLAAVHLPAERGEDAGARGTHRVTEGDAGPVDVDALLVVLLTEAQFPGAGGDLGGERLVDLDQVEVGEGESGPSECRVGGRDGAEAHRRGG